MPNPENSVALLDLKLQYESIQDEIETAVLEVLRSQRFILGPEVEQCERTVAEYCETAHGVGVASGTDALLIALMAEGIGPGDEVITTPYTFFATAGSIARVGATPVFVDICPTSYNIAVDQIADRVTANTRAIIPVHLFGQMADMGPVMAIAKERGLVVIEDAAQAIGAEYEQHRAGSMGDYGCLSFFPSKNLGAAGDGGMVVTQDAERAEKLRVLRAHGSKPKYYHRLIGGNFRLDAIQAAVVNVKAKYLDRWTERRQENARLYDQLFRESGLVEQGLIGLPQIVTQRHIFNQYVVRVEARDDLRSYLRDNFVGSEVYYPRSLHSQECFSYLGYRDDDLPNATQAAAETLALPIHPELTSEQIVYVANTVEQFLQRNAVGSLARQ